MANEEAAVGLPEGRDEVLRQIGRNLVIFQEIEQMLKFLVAANGFETTAGDAADAMARALSEHEQKTLGQIKKDFVERFLSDASEAIPIEPPRELRIRSTVTLELDAARRAEYIRVLDELIVDRNEFVHQFRARYDLKSAEGIADAARALEDQCQRARLVHADLASLLDTLRAGYGVQAEILASDEGRKELEAALLQSSNLVRRLAEVAAERQRPDGWTLLSTAGTVLRREFAQERPKLWRGYGIRKLRDVLMASQAFAVEEEPTAGGRTRTVYRSKSRA